MERLTLIRRPKAGDKVECLPAGDGLPVWTTIPLDAKLPMMQNPKGSVILYTTKLGQSKHRCKQEYDFDLRDPNGKYISTVYHPLHDPHLKSYFNRDVMRRHLNKKGFISKDGKVLCSLREFNHYRRYLRHIFFLEIAKERKEELERRAAIDRKTELDKKMSRGAVIRKRLQQQNDRHDTELKTKITLKTEKLENRLKAIREEMMARARKQREEFERRQMAMHRCQHEAEQRNQMLIKKLRQKDRFHQRLIEDREARKKIQVEMKCLEKWKERKVSQKERLDRQGQILQQEDQFRQQSITERERLVNKQRSTLEKKIEALKEMSRERKRKRDERYAKRFEEKLASGDYRKWTRTREKRHKHRTFNSTWDLKDVLKNLKVTETLQVQEKPEVAVVEDIQDDEGLNQKAREIVSGIIDKVQNEIYPAFLRSLAEDGELNNEAGPSKSVRFSHEPEGQEESWTKVDISVTDEDAQFRPVTEHVLTPCASQLEVQKPETDKLSSASFVETILLRLLDDLNSGRIANEDIMKLASYAMELIQSTDEENRRSQYEFDCEGAAVLSSSSSIIAKKMVDFTLNRILMDIQSGNVHRDNLASLTVSLVDLSHDDRSSIYISDTALNNYIDGMIRAATSSALDPREDSPVCEALLDNFMVNTLKKLMTDLEQESLNKDQIQILAQAVKDETSVFTDISELPLKSLRDIQLVLETFLTQLKSGNIDSQSLYQIVFTIVYSYSIIKSSSLDSYESKITTLVKDVLDKAGEKVISACIDNVNHCIVHEASERLSQTVLDIGQIEQISSSIMTVSTKSDVICKTTSSEIARSIIEESLVKAKEQIESEQIDPEILGRVQNVAEAVILALSPEAQSPPLVDVFVEILEQLKEDIGNRDQGNIDELNELNDLIHKIKSKSIGPDDVADMATTIAEIAKCPPRSDASLTALHAVKSALMSIRDDLAKGKMKDDIIKEMVDSLQFSCKNVILSDHKSPELLICLAGFIRTILNLLSSKMRTGELNQNDLDELSNDLQRSIEAKTLKSEAQDGKGEEAASNTVLVVKADNVFEYLSYLIENIETGEMRPDELKNLGSKLIESGQTLMASLSERPSTINTDKAADSAVEEVLRTLQMEIENGSFTKDSLKEITKSIFTSASDSDFADQLIDDALRGIERDVVKGYNIGDIPSLPSFGHSPSASTVASFVVTKTINELRKNISAQWVPDTMVRSIASSLVSYLSPGETQLANLPDEFMKNRDTIMTIVTCLRHDRISLPETEKLFCLILERYREFMAKEVESKEEPTGLSLEDSDLVKDLVHETLRSIEQNVASGKIFDKESSIPSITSSHNTSAMADELVEMCLQTIKDHMHVEEDASSKETNVIVDFMIQTIEILQTELANGSISNLSMATFFSSISTDPADLKTLENNAADNLASILDDMKKNRSNSVYVSRIMDTYISKERTDGGTLSDPVKAVKAILVNVSFDILTKFVRATIENMIMDIQDGSLPRDSSTCVLGDASSAVAKSVVKRVLEKVKSDLGGSVGEPEIERAASRLLTSSQTERRETYPSPAQQHSTTSTKRIEDNILESLHNVVSNLRLEQSLLLQGGRRGETDRHLQSSRDIHDFILQTMQTIVTDLQDRRAQIDMAVSKTEGTAPEMVSKESLQATAYVNKILNTVLSEMRSEILIKSQTSANGEQDVSSSQERELSVIDTMIKAFFGAKTQLDGPTSGSSQNVSSTNVEETSYVQNRPSNVLKVASSIFAEGVVKTVLETIQRDQTPSSVGGIGGRNASNIEVEKKASEQENERDNMPIHERKGSLINTMSKALSASAFQSKNSGLEQKQKDDIKLILMESIKSTLVSVKEGKFDQEELMFIYESIVTSLDDETVAAAEGEHASQLQNKVLSLLMSLYLKMENLSVNDEMLDKLSSHLATVGMELTYENEDPTDEIVCNSSEVNGLVRDIVAKLSEQLVDVEALNEPAANGTTDEDEGQESVDQNFNRRISESSISTLNKDSSDSSSTSINALVPKRKVLGRYKTKSLDNADSSSSSASLMNTKPERRVIRRSLDSQVHTPSLTKNDDRLLNRQSMPKPNINKTPHYVRSNMNTVAPKVKKDTPIPTQCRAPIASDRGMYARSRRGKGLVPGSQNTTPVRVTEIKQHRARAPTRTVSDLTRISPEDSEWRFPSTQSQSQSETPLELKSLCGVHKTRIHYRKVDVDDSTTDDGSYTSELF